MVLDGDRRGGGVILWMGRCRGRGHMTCRRRESGRWGTCVGGLSGIQRTYRRRRVRARRGTVALTTTGTVSVVSGSSFDVLLLQLPLCLLPRVVGASLRGSPAFLSLAAPGTRMSLSPSALAPLGLCEPPPWLSGRMMSCLVLLFPS